MRRDRRFRVLQVVSCLRLCLPVRGFRVGPRCLAVRRGRAGGRRASVVVGSQGSSYCGPARGVVVGGGGQRCRVVVGPGVSSLRPASGRVGSESDWVRPAGAGCSVPARVRRSLGMCRSRSPYEGCREVLVLLLRVPSMLLLSCLQLRVLHARGRVRRARFLRRRREGFVVVHLRGCPRPRPPLVSRVAPVRRRGRSGSAGPPGVRARAHGSSRRGPFSLGGRFAGDRRFRVVSQSRLLLLLLLRPKKFPPFLLEDRRRHGFTGRRR